MKKTIIKDENYFTVFGWMRNQLKLNGNELNVYAVIYGFSQDGESEFKGSQAYIMDFTGIQSNNTLCRILKSLKSKGYIEELSHNSQNGKTNTYKAVPKEQVINKLENNKKGYAKIADLQDIVNKKEENPKILGYAKIADPVCENYIPGYAKIADPLNNDDKNIIDKDNYIEESKKENNKYINNKGQSSDFEKTQEGNYPRESYAELMDKHNLSKELKNTLWKFIQHSLMNNTFITNDKLERLILLLLENYSRDIDRIELILTAIDKGYVDVKRSKVLKPFASQREYSQDYFDSLITKITKEKAV